jgi:hypothetical protein
MPMKKPISEERIEEGRPEAKQANERTPWTTVDKRCRCGILYRERAAKDRAFNYRIAARPSTFAPDRDARQEKAARSNLQTPRTVARG